MGENDLVPWDGGRWPIGGMAAAGLAAGEAFKIAMRKLQHVARNPGRMVSVFADTDELTFSVAPADTPFCNELGNFDCVSGGAIINAALYALARIPGVSGRGRIIEPDTSGLSNLNRYMLLLRSQLERSKTHDLAELLSKALTLEPIAARYEPDLLNSIAPLAGAVLVGVDDIPTRWAVQRAWPRLLVVGATTHWSAMASFHTEGLGCAQCLHAEDDPSDAPIPTVAFVSFWAGLLAAAYFLRHAAGQMVPPSDQQIYLTPLRAEHPYRANVPVRTDCPTCLAKAA